MQMSLRRAAIVALAAVICGASLPPARSLAEEYPPLKDKYQRDPQDVVSFDYTGLEDTYAHRLATYAENGWTDAGVVCEASGTPAERLTLPYADDEGRRPEVYGWADGERQTWRFDVERAGLYQIEVLYYLNEANDAASCALKIDGRTPFSECGELHFTGGFRDERKEPLVNRLGDQLRPRQIPIRREYRQALCDNQGMYVQPLRFYFEAGEAGVELALLNGELFLTAVRLIPCEEPPSYEAVAEGYAAAGYGGPEGADILRFEAETEAVEKNSASLRRESDADPKCSPLSIRTIAYNVMGSSSWKSANQTIVWEFYVDKPGLYKLSLRALQNYTEGLSVYRQIAVDGRVPFRELLAYEFPYNREWRLETLHGGDGEPFLFYFAKGTHSIGMTVKMGPAAAVMRALYEDSQALSELLLSIKMITTSDPDPNYDYELEEQIPELLPRLEELAARAADTIALIGKPNGKTPSISNALNQNIDILRSLLKRPDRIAVGLSDLESVQETLSSWYVSLQSMALAVDCFYIVPRDQEAVMEKAGFFDKLGAVLEGLFVSYFRDYNSVGGLAEGNRTLDVWIGRGKEWAEVFKRLTDDSFTPETGVEVRLNVLPASQLSGGGNNTLMLAVTSGNAPDVALGVGAGMPVEFAIRSAAVDLSRLEGFEETFAQFPENIRVPYTYKGGVYGLPETMDFRVLFYRKDILARLGAALPETWDEVYGDLLPLLYQNNMEMYVAADFSMFLYQNGGRYYTEDTARSGLDTPEAFRAFKQTTELFTNYGIPVSASFYNRFRSGIMPVGISGFADYMTLLVAAPEIGGKWGIAPIPGTRREDGGVDHSFSGMAVDGAMILADSEKKQDAWQLLRWWMSAETQVQYARDIEAMIGLSARWSTANVKANDAISWDREDIAVIREQRRWAREIPNVAGGYYTGRYVNNAWNSVVIGGERLRDSLEEAVFAINKELAKKQKQYGTGQEAET